MHYKIISMQLDDSIIVFRHKLNFSKITTNDDSVCLKYFDILQKSQKHYEYFDLKKENICNLFLK